MKKLPKKNVKERNKVLKTFELSEAENEILIQSSEKLGISQAQFIRRAIEEKIRRLKNGNINGNIDLSEIKNMIGEMLSKQNQFDKHRRKLDIAQDKKINEIINIEKNIAEMYVKNGVKGNIEIVKEALKNRNLTFGELKRITSLSKPIASQILKDLKAKGLIDDTKNGKWSWIIDE